MEENKCKNIKKNLSAYFDNELDNDEYLKIEHHLRHCSTCRDELKDIILLSKTLKGFSSRIKYDLSDISDNVLYNIYEDDDIACDEVQDKLFDYTNGEVDIKDYYKIEKHLESCTSCSKKLENIEKDKKEQRNIYIVPVEENNSSCANIRPRLPDFLDKELSKEESAIIAKHLLSCADCRGVYDNLKITKSAISSYLKKNHDVIELPNVSDIKVSKFWLASIIIIFIALFSLVSEGVFKALSDTAENRIEKVKDLETVKPIYVNLGKNQEE